MQGRVAYRFAANHTSGMAEPSSRAACRLKNTLCGRSSSHSSGICGLLVGAKLRFMCYHAPYDGPKLRRPFIYDHLSIERD